MAAGEHLIRLLEAVIDISNIREYHIPIQLIEIPKVGAFSELVFGYPRSHLRVFTLDPAAAQEVILVER